MKRQSLFFVSPEKVEVLIESIDEPTEGQALVRSLYSAISPGTEILAYRGQIPEEMTLDAAIGALEGSAHYPFKYGYAVVGEVIAVGKNTPESWVGKRVFAFHPHESLFNSSTSELIPLPDDVAVEDAIFLPNMETAVNFLQDGRPLIGEMVGVWGLGIVGLLTTALLAQFPLGRLVTFDRYVKRRRASLELGADVSMSPEKTEWNATDMNTLRTVHEGFDLAYEISGSSAALNQAIEMTGYGGRVVIGSWYGTKAAQLRLGGAFHRSRIKLMSSQVSTISPELSGRWDKSRRFETAWKYLGIVQPRRWITQAYPLEKAAEAFQKISGEPQETIQVVLKYI